MSDLKTTKQVWSDMKQRCRNPKCGNYPHYGARGILVCARWEAFSNFLADMGLRPAGKTLDRVNNDGNYEPGNCRWATRAEQNANRRVCHMIEIDGVTKPLRYWAREGGIHESTLLKRWRRGKRDRESLFATPIAVFSAAAKKGCANRMAARSSAKEATP